MNETAAPAATIQHIEGFAKTLNFETVSAAIPWHQQVRKMYGRSVATPRLTFNAEPAELPAPLAAVVEELEKLLDSKFQQAGCNLYRNGADSVAWHRDLKGAERDDATIAIVSIGGTRSFQTRQNGGTAETYHVAHGDVFVMSGDAQHTHEHRIAKTAKHVAPRISIALRSIADQW